MDRQNIVHLYNGLLFRSKREGDSDTCYNMDEPGGHDAQGEKQTRKDTHCLTPLTGGPWRSQIHRDRKQMVGPGPGKGEGSECFMGTEFQFGTLRKFWRWMVGMVSQRFERA